MAYSKKRPKKKKEEYTARTHPIHGNYESKKWDYDHHVIPPITSSTTHRGALGFVEFASDEADRLCKVPIYIYDRLDEPSRGMGREPGLCRGGGGGDSSYLCYRDGRY